MADDGRDGWEQPDIKDTGKPLLRMRFAVESCRGCGRSLTSVVDGYNPTQAALCLRIRCRECEKINYTENKISQNPVAADRNTSITEGQTDD